MYLMYFSKQGCVQCPLSFTIMRQAKVIARHKSHYFVMQGKRCARVRKIISGNVSQGSASFSPFTVTVIKTVMMGQMKPIVLVSQGCLINRRESMCVCECYALVEVLSVSYITIYSSRGILVLYNE